MSIKSLQRLRGEPRRHSKARRRKYVGWSYLVVWQNFRTNEPRLEGRGAWWTLHKVTSRLVWSHHIRLRHIIPCWRTSGSQKSASAGVPLPIRLLRHVLTAKKHTSSLDELLRAKYGHSRSNGVAKNGLKIWECCVKRYKHT